VLVLGLCAAIPALAEEAPEQTQPELEATTVELEETLFTPMDGPQGLITVDDLAEIHLLRECDPVEVQTYCPGCENCILAGWNYYCIGC
jgi:hypothetical protein